MSHVTGSIFATRALWNRVSDPSEAQAVVKGHVEEALSHQGYYSDITISTDYSFDTSDYDQSDKDLVDLRDNHFRSEFLDGHSDTSPHFNMLLLIQNEWPNPDGSLGVATIDDKDDPYPRGGVYLGGDIIYNHGPYPDRYGDRDSEIESRIRGAIHEIGHNLGMKHKHGLRYNGYDYADNTQYTRATPMGCDSDQGWETSCGTSCTTDYTEQWDHYYGECEAQNMNL